MEGELSKAFESDIILVFHEFLDQQMVSWNLIERCVATCIFFFKLIYFKVSKVFHEKNHGDDKLTNLIFIHRRTIYVV